jgi:hypothetical protein
MSKKFEDKLTNEKLEIINRLFNHYKLLALNRYKWTNLPNKIESRHIEDFLFSRGQAFFTDDERYGYICLPCRP